MNTRALVVFLTFIIWGQVCWRWYTCEVKGFYRDSFGSSGMDQDSAVDEKDITVTQDMEYVSLRSAGAVLYFPYKSSETTFDSSVESYLHELSIALKEKPVQVTIIGHTDGKGSEGYNYELGLQRAQAVAEELKKQGVPGDKLKVISKGETEPLQLKDARLREQKNRRVEIELGS